MNNYLTEAFARNINSKRRLLEDYGNRSQKAFYTSLSRDELHQAWEVEFPSRVAKMYDGYKCEVDPKSYIVRIFSISDVEVELECLITPELRIESRIVKFENKFENSSLLQCVMICDKLTHILSDMMDMVDDLVSDINDEIDRIEN